MQKFLMTVAAGVVAVAAQAMPAHATIVDVIARGTVISSSDTNGEFGLVNGNYAGMPYQVHLRYNTALGSLSSGTFFAQLSGSLLSQPMLMTEVTINGHTSSVPTTGNGGVTMLNFPNPGPEESRATFTGSYFATLGPGVSQSQSVQASFTGFYNTLPPDIDGPLNFVSTAGLTTHKSVYQNYIYTSVSYFVQNLIVADITSFSVQPYVAPAAPEPSTWAMMMLGFAGIGTLAWRRRKAQAAA